jgi:hypothetical protein
VSEVFADAEDAMQKASVTGTDHDGVKGLQDAGILRTLPFT